MRVIYLIISMMAAVAGAYYGQPLVRENTDAITVMITVMTVFAGFLVAVIAILGDPSMTPKGSWRIAEHRHSRIEAEVIRHTWLFYCYLIAIGFLFAGVLIRKEPQTAVSDRVKNWVEYAYLFFAVFSFMLTLALPRALGRIQLARSAAEIEQRRVADGIEPHKPAS